MDELLTKENIDYKERAREVAEKYVRPRAAELDQTREYGLDILEALKSYELTGSWIPKEYGGHDAGLVNRIDDQIVDVLRQQVFDVGDLLGDVVLRIHQDNFAARGLHHPGQAVTPRNL